MEIESILFDTAALIDIYRGRVSMRARFQDVVDGRFDCCNREKVGISSINPRRKAGKGISKRSAIRSLCGDAITKVWCCNAARQIARILDGVVEIRLQ